MNALVTGANGTIGSCLVALLAERGHQTRALVRPASDRSLLSGVDTEIVEGDICDVASLQQAAAGCDWIFHLAAARPANAPLAHEFASVNVQGTKNVAEAAGSAGVKRLVFASSVGVYGFVTRGPIDETFPLRPDTRYRRSKVMAETHLLDRFNSDGLPVVIARLSSIVGPGAKSWAPLYRAASRPGFRMIGPGTNRVQIGYVTDAADCLVRCAETSGIEGEILNVSGTEPILVREYVELIRSALGVQGRYATIPKAPFVAYARLTSLLSAATGYQAPLMGRYGVFLNESSYDLSKAHTLLNFQPEITTTECVRRMAHYFRDTGILEP